MQRLSGECCESIQPCAYAVSSISDSSVILLYSTAIMRLLTLGLFGAAVLFAQSPSITGVWKADLQQSKISGPPLTNYLEIIEQKMVVVDRRSGEKGPEIDETTGSLERQRRATFYAQLSGDRQTCGPAVSRYSGALHRQLGRQYAIAERGSVRPPHDAQAQL